MTKTYGDPKFTNPIMPDYPGSGAITYSSSDSAIATVNSDNGEVTIHKAGSAVIKAEKAQDPDYTSAQAEYQLTVGKKHLTVTADDKFISFGDPVPNYTYTFNGFANGDTEAVVSGTPALSCAYTPASGKGSYKITIAIGTLSAENYEFIFFDGAVSAGLANQAPLSIDDPGAKAYGDSSFTLTTSGGTGTGAVSYTLVSGDAIDISDDIVTIEKAGQATVKAHKAGDEDYNPVESSPITITVDKRSLTYATVSVGGTTHRYTGSAITPVPTVLDSGLITASDYEVEDYANNTHPGTATVTITATAEGNYTGSQTGTFTILQAAGASVTSPAVSGTPTSSSITVVAVSLAAATGQDIEYAISTASNGTGLSVWQAGTTFSGLTGSTTYYVYARSKENANYEAGTASMSAGIATATVYTVTFNSNGGSSVTSQTVSQGGTATRPANPTKTATTSGTVRTSFYFVNWYADSGLTTVYNFSTPVSSSITIYARWVENAMVSLSAGSFTMGSPSTEPGRGSNENQHSVTLSAFSIGKYQVTQELYEAVMGSNPSYFTTANSRPPDSGETDNKRPVEQVSWYDALVFCNKLSMLEGLSPAYQISGSTNPDNWGTVPTSSDAAWNAAVVVGGANGYRLPTEAQWEYACRAGTTTAFNNGNNDYTDATSVGAVAWHSGNSGSKTHEVGKKAANNWGLYDMHGNVYEWCWDWYDSGYYASSPSSDPQGASLGANRVRRGGGWNGTAQRARSAFRISNYPNDRYDGIGFRLARP